MGEMNLPDFKGIPIRRKDGKKISVSYLNGEFGRWCFDKYMELKDRNYKANLVLNVVRFEEGLVKGSGPYVAGLMNEVVYREGLRMATLADIEAIIEHKAFDLHGSFEYPALVLRSLDNPYSYIGKAFAQEMQEATGAFNPPILISIASTKLVNEDSMDGLSFRIRAFDEIVHAPQLSYDNDGRTFSETDKDGLPIYSDDGTRSFCGLESGLSVLCVDRELDFDSEGGSFRGVSSAGRLIAVKEE